MLHIVGRACVPCDFITHLVSAFPHGLLILIGSLERGSYGVKGTEIKTELGSSRSTGYLPMLKGRKKGNVCV